MTDKTQVIDNALFGVTTFSEAARCWKKQRKTIEMAIAKGYIQSRQVDERATVLISVSSLIRHWGNPKQKLSGQE